MRNVRIGLGWIALACWSIAAADTVYLKDGSTVDGKVSQPNPNCVIVQTKDTELVLQPSEVDRIEQNEKMGVYVNPAAARHEKQLQERTGLTAEQRAELDALLEPLKSESADERAKAKAALLRKADEVDLFRYLETSLSGLTGLYVPQVLEVLVQLDPKRALPVLRQSAEHREPVVRAKALELLAKSPDAADVELLARGVVDPAREVKTSAILALRARAEKRATPLLIDCLNDPDKRVRNTAAVGLAGLWADAAPPTEATLQAWQAFWDAHSAAVQKPWDTASLVRLTGEDPQQATYHNE